MFKFNLPLGLYGVANSVAGDYAWYDCVMNSVERPTSFYLFPKGNDIEIREMSDVAAVNLWEKGVHWLDMPQRTLSEAEQLKAQLRASRFYT